MIFVVLLSLLVTAVLCAAVWYMVNKIKRLQNRQEGMAEQLKENEDDSDFFP